MVIHFLDDVSCDSAETAAFVCLLLQWTCCSWDHLFQSSDAPSGKPGPRWAFWYLCPVIKGRALGERLKHSRCAAQECTQHCSFLTHCVTLLGKLLCFSAIEYYGTDFCMCSVAPCDQKPCKRLHLGQVFPNSSPAPVTATCVLTLPLGLSSLTARWSTKWALEGIFWAKDFPPAGCRKAHLFLSGLALPPSSLHSWVQFLLWPQWCWWQGWKPGSR